MRFILAGNLLGLPCVSVPVSCRSHARISSTLSHQQLILYFMDFRRHECLLDLSWSTYLRKGFYLVVSDKGAFELTLWSVE